MTGTSSSSRRRWCCSRATRRSSPSASTAASGATRAPPARGAGARRGARDRADPRFRATGNRARDDPERTARTARPCRRGLHPRGGTLPVRAPRDRSRSPCRHGRRVRVSLAAPRASAAGNERTLADRFLAAFPLLAVFFWLCVVYAWEAWRHGSPWLFGDELELTQLSRAIATTGHAARRGE